MERRGRNQKWIFSGSKVVEKFTWQWVNTAVSRISTVAVVDDYSEMTRSCTEANKLLIYIYYYYYSSLHNIQPHCNNDNNNNNGTLVDVVCRSTVYYILHNISSVRRESTPRVVLQYRRRAYVIYYLPKLVTGHIDPWREKK